MRKIIATALLSLVLAAPAWAETDPAATAGTPLMTAEEMRRLMLEKEQAAREGFQTFRMEGQEVLRKEADMLREKALEEARALREGVRSQSGSGSNDEDMQAIRKDALDKARLIRANALEAIQTKRVETREAFEAKRLEVRDAIVEGREEFRKAIDAKREEAKTAAEARREELKKKLEAVKDERKKSAVENIDQKIADLNSRQMAHFTEKLEQMEGVLERIVSRADKAEAGGRDVAPVRMAISDANTAIDASRALITAQTGKTYAINVTSENALRAEVQAVRDALKTDLDKVKDGVKDAHDALREAATTLAQIPGVDAAQAPATSTASDTN